MRDAYSGPKTMRKIYSLQNPADCWDATPRIVHMARGLTTLHRNHRGHLHKALFDAIQHHRSHGGSRPNVYRKKASRLSQLIEDNGEDRTLHIAVMTPPTKQLLSVKNAQTFMAGFIACFDGMS